MLRNSAMAAVASIAAMLAAPANAFTIQAGDYKMTVDGYINGTVYGMPSGGTCGGDTATAANIAACDAAPQLAPVGAIGSEDSWGILSIASIVRTSDNFQYFTRGTNGYIIGSVTGLTDFSSGVYTAPGFGTYQLDHSTGGAINLYRSNANYNPAVASSDQANVIASVTNLPLWLSLDFVLGATDPGVDATGAAATYVSNFNYGSGTGSGSGFLSVTGGSVADKFDTNTLMTGAGLTADASFDVTLGRLTPNDRGYGNWLASSTAAVRGYALPEPGSLALVGAGLIGFAGLRRRKHQA